MSAPAVDNNITVEDEDEVVSVEEIPENPIFEEDIEKSEYIHSKKFEAIAKELSYGRPISPTSSSCSPRLNKLSQPTEKHVRSVYETYKNLMLDEKKERMEKKLNGLKSYTPEEMEVLIRNRRKQRENVQKNKMFNEEEITKAFLLLQKHKRDDCFEKLFKKLSKRLTKIILKNKLPLVISENTNKLVDSALANFYLVSGANNQDKSSYKYYVYQKLAHEIAFFIEKVLCEIQIQNTDK